MQVPEDLRTFESNPMTGLLRFTFEVQFENVLLIEISQIQWLTCVIIKFGKSRANTFRVSLVVILSEEIGVGKPEYGLRKR